MNFENFERGYLLPKGCKDLIDVIRLQQNPEPKFSIKLPAVLKKPHPGISLNQASPSPAMQGYLFVPEHTIVKELAALLEQKVFQIIADAMQLGIFPTADQPLGFKVVSHIAQKYGYTAKRVA